MHVDLFTTVIGTERLLLIPISDKYAEEIFHEFVPEITKYMFPVSPKNVAETSAYIHSVKHKMQKGEELVVAILEKETGEFLGGAGAHNLHTSTPELGIWIKRKAHGHNYGKEAVTALKEWIDSYLTYEYIIYPVDKRNIPSRKIAEALGGVMGAEYKKQKADGTLLDDVEYRIYPSIKPVK